MKTIKILQTVRNSSLARVLVAAILIGGLAACAPQAEREAASGPPPAPPVIYDANAFDVFQAVFQTISQAPGVPGWEFEKTRGGFLGIGGTTYVTTYGDSGSWSIRQSDRAAGFIRAETVNRGVVNPSGSTPDREHALTVAISGPDEAGPTQVVVSVSTERALYMIDRIHAALDQRFERVE